MEEQRQQINQGARDARHKPYTVGPITQAAASVRKGPARLPVRFPKGD